MRVSVCVCVVGGGVCKVFSLVVRRTLRCELPAAKTVVLSDASGGRQVHAATPTNCLN